MNGNILPPRLNVIYISEGTNVEEAANFLVQKIIDNEKWLRHQRLENGRDVRDYGGDGSTAFALSAASNAGA